MKWTAFACLLLAACAPSPPRAAVPVAPRAVDLRPRAAVGSTYEILHREIRHVGDARPRRVDTRSWLEILEVRPDGTRLALVGMRRFYRGADLSDGLLPGTFEVVIRPDGRVADDPSSRCPVANVERADRYLRHLFSSRALAARRVGEGQRWTAPLHLDTSELPLRASARLDRVADGEAEGRLSAPLSLDAADLGGLRLSGDGRVRGRFRVSVDDGFTGRTELTTTIDGEATQDGRRRRVEVRVESKILVRAARPPADAFACVGTMDPERVVAAIRARIQTIQACYEAGLARNPTLAGRIVLQLTIRESGRVDEPRVTEDSLGDPAVIECAAGVLREMTFDPPPRGGPVVFAYPFVFAPQN